MVIAHFSGLPTDSLQKFCLLLIGIYKLGENNILRLGLHCYYLAGRIFQRDLSRMLHLFYKNAELELICIWSILFFWSFFLWKNIWFCNCKNTIWYELQYELGIKLFLYEVFKKIWICETDLCEFLEKIEFFGILEYLFA